MKILNFLLLTLLCSGIAYAEKESHHDHVGSNSVAFSSELLDFENSKKKTDGKRYGIELDHQDVHHHYRFYYEKSITQTTAVLPDNLKVNKYALKYAYRFNNKQELSFSYINIDDNLMKETDNGHIHGLGYKYKALTLTQYLSDYKNFDVYQTSLKVGIKKKFDDIVVMAGISETYIHLKDKESNNFSKKAKDNYFTTGLKVHAHYDSYHVSLGTYMGKRIFAVMNEGLKVQHHSMEFKESYLFDIGKKFNNLSIHLRYAKHKAKEVPIENDKVNVQNITLEIDYHF